MMAKLSAHGTEVARIVARGHAAYSLRSDGEVLRKLAVEGCGWKRWKKVKPGVEPQAAVAQLRAYANRLEREMTERP